MSGRWSIYIDIEGFSLLWEREDRVLWSLGELMRSIFRVGRRCFPDSPLRLFAHQVGDGFLIVSDFHEQSLDRCTSIATALMRHVAQTGRLARAAISEGELSDIQGCYPTEVLDCMDGERAISLHMGMMTIFPVMGTALIRAVAVDKVAPRGPLLTIHASKVDRLGPSILRTPIVGSDLASIDWVHLRSELLDYIQEHAALGAPTPSDLETLLRRYCAQEPVPDDWRQNVHELLRVPRVVS